MTKLYPFNHQYVKDNYPLVYKIFSEPHTAPLTNEQGKGYLYFRKQIELLKQRQSDKA